MAAAIDTLKFSERLSDGGFTHEQATTAAKALAEVMSEDIATKVDLEALRLQIEGKLTELRLQLESKITQTRLDLESKITEARLDLESKIADSRLSLEDKIAQARTEILKWTIGMSGFQTLAVIGALFAMLKMFMK